MVIKRQKLDRKVNLILDGDRVVDMPPGWNFTIDCPHHGKFTFDFNPYREHSRDELAGHMRDAFWSLRHEVVGISLRSYASGVSTFWRFLDDLDSKGEAITHLIQVDRTLLDRFRAWMELQSISIGKKQGRPLSLAMKKKTFNYVKALLINRQKRVPEAINHELTFPRNPYPNSNKLIPKREPYSVSEQRRIVAALNKDLRSIHEGGDETLPDLQVLAVHLLVLGLATGRNLQPLLDMRRDALQPHPLPDRDLLITYKRRGWSTHATSVRNVGTPEDCHTLQAIPATVVEHFRFLCEFTSPLTKYAALDHRELVFLWQVPRLSRKGQVVPLKNNNVCNAMKSFLLRHNLMDDRNRPLALNVARMRPTFATELYRRTRDIRRVQQALGHASPETTARHYTDAPFEAERDHAMVLEGMVSQFTRMEIEGKVLLAADGKIPLQNVKDLLSGGYNTGIARCKNPFRDDESVCKKFFTCFRCPNMMVFEDDLWRLFSFYYRLLSERAKLNPSHWLKTYGPIIRRIDADIASQFPVQKIAEARTKAQENPHPTWRGPLL